MAGSGEFSYPPEGGGKRVGRFEMSPWMLNYSGSVVRYGEALELNILFKTTLTSLCFFPRPQKSSLLLTLKDWTRRGS